MQAVRLDAASGKAITRLPSASAVTISASQRQGSSGSQQTRGTLPTHSGGLKVPDRALAYPQHQQARGCEWRHGDKRHNDTDENRQETDPAGDGANCFHDVPLSTVDLAAPSARLQRMISLQGKYKHVLIDTSRKRFSGDQMSLLRPGSKPIKRTQQRLLRGCEAQQPTHTVRTAVMAALWRAKGT